MRSLQLNKECLVSVSPGLGSQRRLLVLVLSTVVLACNGRQEEAREDVPSHVFTEHRATLVSAATKELGEDCTRHGASECLTGLCLHTQAEPRRGYICSSTCRSMKECPEEWSCAQLHPGESTRVCVPPDGWSERAVKRRGAEGAGSRSTR